MLEDSGVDYNLVLYMKQKPDETTLADLVSKLEDNPADLVRRDKFFNDKVVAESGFDPDSLSDPEVVVELLAQYPRLLQRPVVVKGDRAIIGRPRHRVPDLLA